MLNSKTIVAIIPARGGSKGILKKNIVSLAGKPLIVWTIEAAQQSKYIDRLILSSDDPEIISTAQQYNCDVPFIRPAELSQDNTPGIDPVLHALETIDKKYDYVVLLQPTSPLRSAEDIDSCIEYCLSNLADCCVSVTEPDKSPYWMYFIDEAGKMKPVIETKQLATRRQDLPRTYVLNGAIYVAKCECIKREKTFLTDKTIAFPMPKERSIDIDSYTDLKLAAFILESNTNK